MGRRKSIKVEVAHSTKELHELIDNLTNEFNLDNYQIEISSTFLVGMHCWFVEVWKL